ncbi:MAG: TAT-variant-translocated molybdopterin oxidoreductase [Planctomycetota bacterium]
MPPTTMKQSTTQQPTTKQRISKYWRSIDELENSPEFQEFLHREFPQAASELPQGISRRRWLQLMGASFTLAAAQGCRWQTEKFAAFAERPEGYVPGMHTKFATSIEVAGMPRHLLVTCYDQRPIKIDGNPEHPGSLGGSDGYSQALTLSLYDPDRQSKVIERDGRATFNREWSDFQAFARTTLERLAPKSGEGLAVLMQPTSSIATKAALKNLIDTLPQTAIFEYAPLSRDNELAGAEMAFGKPVRTHHDVGKADVIACFDADLLNSFPTSAVAARAYAERREPSKEKNSAGMNRLYAVESQYSLTGASADHRLAVKSSAIPAMLAELRDAVSARLSGETPEPPAAEGKEEGAKPNYAEAFAYALAEDLAGSQGKSLVAVGPGQAAEAHAIAHEINALLGNVGETVIYTDEPEPVAQVGSLADLLGEIAAKRVDTLLVLGGNPVYDSPADFDVAEYLGKTPHTIHLSEYDNETSRFCQWSLPEAHALETWGAVAAWDGTISTSQPLIEPLLDGRSTAEVLTLLADGPGVDPKQQVRDAVADAVGELDDDAWNKLLHDGFVQSDTPPADAVLVRNGFEAPAAPADDTLELVFTPSSHTYDGRFANNGWLQETPDFLTKLTWDNAALIAPETAKAIGAQQGELISLRVGEAKIEAPAFIQPGQAAGSIGLALGYGRTAAGRVGGMINEDGSKVRSEMVKGQRGNWGRYLPFPPFFVAADPVGVDSYELRTSDAMHTYVGVEASATGSFYQLATTQDHHAIDEDLGGEALAHEETERRSGELIREATLATYEESPDFAKHVGAHVPDVELWNELTHDDNRAWGMAIDLNKCIGCNACSVACQAENNVPVVGKDQVARSREMHWLRIDRYYTGDPMGSGGAPPRIAHQPLTCQHCETAPCEQVCPVAATIHSDEGLNDMVYNRCVGTRYCANNCPFKVRRFNFFHYTDRFDDANNELMRLVMNPEVTVRSRGVMEKCTYCTQRISKARIEAKNENRSVRDGDVVTACQEACSTQAIVFGDLNDESSQVAAWHKSERAYTLLDGLRLKPRTKYLAKVLNPHELLEPFVDLPTQPLHHGDGHHGDGHHGDGHHEEGHHGDDHHGDEPAHDGVPEGANSPAPVAKAGPKKSRNRFGDLPIIA